MNKKLFLMIFFGTIMIFLGLLWFLQGSDLIHIKPILCFANCEPIFGKSLQWQVIGAVFFIVGATVICAFLKRISYKRKT
jgi:hypothetical protein